MLSARDQLCKNEAARQDALGISRHCNPQDCPRACGFYEKSAKAICELLSTRHGYSRAVIEEIADRYGICPYEFQLELSELCDIIVCDYNYVFDPNAHLKRFFSEGKKGNYLFLIDEAHNLVERGREMYSAELYKEEFLSLKKKVKEYPVLKYRLKAFTPRYFLL